MTHEEQCKIIAKLAHDLAGAALLRKLYMEVRWFAQLAERAEEQEWWTFDAFIEIADGLATVYGYQTDKEGPGEIRADVLSALQGITAHGFKNLDDPTHPEYDGGAP